MKVTFYLNCSVFVEKNTLPQYVSGSASENVMFANGYSRQSLTLLNGVNPGLTGADANGLFQRCHENLTVTNFAGIGCFGNGFYHLVQ